MAIDIIMDPERKVQSDIINLLHNVHGYEYLGNLKEQENRNILEDELKKFLIRRQHCTMRQAEEAIYKLQADAMR